MNFNWYLISTGLVISLLVFLVYWLLTTAFCERRRLSDRTVTIRSTEYFNIEERVIPVKVINAEHCLKAFNEYLASNEIAGEKYRATSIEHLEALDKITVHLDCIDEDEFIDEDFNSDDKWKEFCLQMAKDLEVRTVGVPYYYYPK